MRTSVKDNEYAVNHDALKVKLFEKKVSYEDIAKVIGRSVTTVTLKMNGRVDFTVTEACIISNFLLLSSAEYGHIFLGKNLTVSKENKEQE